MGKSKTHSSKKESNLDKIIQKVEDLLGAEIESLGDTLDGVLPEKRLDFISKTLPVVIKYRDEHKRESPWELPDWDSI